MGEKAANGGKKDLKKAWRTSAQDHLKVLLLGSKV